MELPNSSILILLTRMNYLQSSSFSENVIRPKVLEFGKLAPLQLDLQGLNSLKHEFVSLDFPFCGSSSRLPSFTKYEFTFDR